MILNGKQTDKLADLFLDVSKGLFLASFAASIATKDIFSSLEYLGLGVLCTIIGLYILRKKKK